MLSPIAIPVIKWTRFATLEYLPVIMLPIVDACPTCPPSGARHACHTRAQDLTMSTRHSSDKRDNGRQATAQPCVLCTAALGRCRLPGFPPFGKVSTDNASLPRGKRNKRLTNCTPPTSFCHTAQASCSRDPASLRRTRKQKYRLHVLSKLQRTYQIYLGSSFSFVI
jgi:hypothetical protein